MILYHVCGRIQQKKKFESYINCIFNDFFAADVKKSVFVNIHFKTRCEDDAAGFCYLNDEDEVVVEVSKTCMNVPYSLDDIAVHLAHELVHAKQHIECRAGFDDHLPYAQKPSEIEAYTLEAVLAEKYWYK